MPSDSALPTGAVESPLETGGNTGAAEGTGGAAGGCGSLDPLKVCEQDNDCAVGRTLCGTYVGITRSALTDFTAWKQECRVSHTGCIPEGWWGKTEDGSAVFGEAEAVARCTAGRCVATADIALDPANYLLCGVHGGFCLIEEYCVIYWSGDAAAPEELRTECGAVGGCETCACLEALGEPPEGCECRDVLDDVEVRCQQ